MPAPSADCKQVFLMLVAHVSLNVNELPHGGANLKFIVGLTAVMIILQHFFKIAD